MILVRRQPVIRILSTLNYQLMIMIVCLNKIKVAHMASRKRKTMIYAGHRVICDKVHTFNIVLVVSFCRLLGQRLR